MLRRFLLAGTQVFGFQVLTAVSWLLITIIIARTLPAAELGIVLFFHSLSLSLGIVIMLGTGASALRFISGARGAGDFVAAATIVRRATVLSFILGAAFLALAAILGQLGTGAMMARFPGLPDWGVHAALWVTAVALRMNAFELLIAEDRPLLAALHSGFGAAAMTAVALIAMLAVGAEVTLAAVMHLATGTAVLSAISAQMNALRCAGKDVGMGAPHSSEVIPGVGVLLRVGFPIMISKALSSRRKEILVIILAAVSSAEAVALLGLANQVVQVIAMPIIAVAVLIKPQIAKAGRNGDLAQNMQRIRSLWSLSVAPVIAIAALSALFAEPLALLAYGPGYGGVAALIVVSIIGRLVTVAAGPGPQTLMMTGHERALAAFSLLEIVPLVILGAVLGSQFGAFGGAWAFTITVTLMAVLYNVYIRLYLGFWIFAWVFPSSLKG
ncbi:lipopolysaccharide biosynthesis protein [Roseinatronobacter sp. S2]|uniref:lipopolysaccharide biosynthesis protein n=1 Tax=Roseinatronobacter sp. S2 TaxID=3035471 RepID=UPI00241046EA|nr:hypothetical protein [Roseinatronobacter sp. S2]WFE75340.1 hypothetical protein P8S53_02755 [Roseinatronobacter sp. S2]